MVQVRWFILWVSLLVVGCESLPGMPYSSPLDRPPQGPHRNPSFLPPSTPPEEQVMSERIVLPEGPGTGRLAANFSTAASLSIGSRLLNPLSTVFFPFDSSEINPEVRDQLKAAAHLMLCFPTHRVRIEGHTDGQGTQSYKMVLGAKRAHAVKEFLSSLGIPAQRLETVSYGKELTECTFAEEESCRQFDRRAELLFEQKNFLRNNLPRKCMVRLDFNKRGFDAPELEVGEFALLPTFSGKDVSLAFTG